MVKLRQEVLGEQMQVVKEFTEVLTREEKKAFIHFPREERGQTHRVASALKGGGLSLLTGFKGQSAGKSGWVHIYFGPQLCWGLLCFYRMWFF